MSNPQPPDLGSDPPSGPVPEENQPGHHPAKEQDKPDLNRFAVKLGVVESSEPDGQPGDTPAAAGRRIPTAALAGAVAALVALVLAVVVGHRRRTNR